MARGLRSLVVVTVAALALPLPHFAAQGQAAGPTRVPLKDFTPLPAAPPVSAEAKATRDRLLGPHYDDPAYVTLHWTGVSSFVVTIGGHLLLFDAWEIIGAVNNYVPIGREELAALDPEAILVGHGHFDHAGDLGYVAGLSHAVVVGSEEICTVGEEGATREGVPTDFTCAITGTMTSPAPGTAQSLKLFADLDPVTILQHIHSNTRPPGGGNALDPYAPVMDPQPYLDHFQDNPVELQRFIGQQQESNQGGTWLYHLRIGAFTILLGDSAGPIFDQPAIQTALDHFPDCIDVMANAILGFDAPVSGLQDPRLYVQYAHPKVFLPTHGDAWAPVLSAGQAQYKDELAAQLATLPFPPQVDHLLDPADYLAERAYRVDDLRWIPPMPGSSCFTRASTGVTTIVPPRPAPPSTPLAATGGGRTAELLGLLLASCALLQVRRARTTQQADG